MFKKKFSLAQSLLPFKSVAVALLFSVFLGPLGLLYATTLGGIVMLVLAFIVASSQLPVPILLVWLGSNVWSVIAVNVYNNRVAQEKLKYHQDCHAQKNN